MSPTTRSLALPLAAALLGTPIAAEESARAFRFSAASPDAARSWQASARETLFKLLMGGARPARVPLEPKVLRRIEMPAGGYVLEELTIQSLPDRRAHAWLGRPAAPRGKVGAVLAINGHGGDGEQVIRGLGLYWYGRALIEMGYVVIAPDVGQHDLQHPSWTLMGERTWDALRCLDLLETLPEVDRSRIAVAGLSLGGETTMYVAALDERLAAACSSGWLTTVANMKTGHCPCFDFPGLERHFDFADIFACVAPRPVVLELGEKERAPGGFPVSIGREAFEEVRAAYRVFGAEEKATLSVHSAGHVFDGRDFWPVLRAAIGPAFPWAPASGDPPGGIADLLRRGEVARRCFARALGVLDGWWRTRDAATGLFPRRLDEPVWAPSDNAADMLPFLALTAYHVAPPRLEEVLAVIPRERALTARLGPLPDWYSLKDRAFVHPQPDARRLEFCAAEYSKDGLLPMTEGMGRGPWTDRMVEMVGAMFEHAPVSSDHGALPADDTEVNGETLLVLSRLYFMTGDEKYLRWAERIGDAYCLEVLPRGGGLPAHRWDFGAHRASADELNLNDHGNEIVGGLSELLVAAKAGDPGKAAAYRDPLRTMAFRLLETARNSDGLWVGRVRASSGEVLDAGTPDTWGYALAGVVNIGRALGEPFGDEAARKALSRIDQPRYLHWEGADAYADSIEGALVLLNRFPEEAGFSWLEKVLPIFLGKQRDDGVVEGWYGDGNYARTALMAALHYTQGVRCEPWSPRLRFGAVQAGGALRLALEAGEPWEGVARLDTPRHRLHLRLPANYPRLNELSEWFTVEPGAAYVVQRAAGAAGAAGRPEEAEMTGAALAAGLPLRVRPGEPAVVEVRKKGG
ncbi:MAG: acetylxylan esterase [Planctomycetes bacterium]|nr:acetylxylan esterase [Planctomycetota bacterium]